MTRILENLPTSRYSAPLQTIALLAVLFANGGRVRAGGGEDPGTLVLDRIPGAAFRFRGLVGERVKNNVDRWLNQAPENNPGLLEMFARRDAGGPPDLVPWAGEFVGKYLISGVQAMRMSGNPQLQETLQSVVGRLVQLQAEDGYLGPWPKHERLRGHWDLWGHYHVMLGLMLWHEQTGDLEAARVVRRIADLVCKTCLDTDFRVLDAGSHEMNMAIIHGMARLYQTSGNPRYLRMANEVLKDFEKAGDYYRTGLQGKEFFRTPKPRWESLHSLQGMVDLYRITGDETYRTAFLQHWASMRRFDYRNTGGFSSGERATGNPYTNDAIETCCVVAFQEVMIDALRLTGNSTIADDLEQTTLNAMLGAQHPSGAWCTYNTPMDGQRIPSHIHINFQARNDTPHLNCCSVNGPRGYGSISQWGVMRSKKGLVLNYYGPMTAQVTLADGTPITIREETDYPLDGTIRVKIDVPQPTRFSLELRIPAWSTETEVALAGKSISGVRPGTYLELDREWTTGDEIVLKLDISVRYEPGDLDQFGKVSLYRGPILLAQDDRFDTNDAIIDVERLAEAKVVSPNEQIAEAAGQFPPWLVADVPAEDDTSHRLIDFASAGATTVDGKPISSYTTWLPAVGARPPRPVAWQPLDGSQVGPGPLRFVWRRPAAVDTDRQHTVVIADSPDFANEVLRFGNNKAGAWVLVPEELARTLEADTTYHWKVIAHNEHGQAESIPPHKRFRIDPTAPPISGN